MKKWLLGLVATLVMGTSSQAAGYDTVIGSLDQPRYTRSIEYNEHRRQTLCLALNIYHEARGSTRNDMVGVAWVTRNRVESRYSKGRDYCQIIWEPGQYSWTRRSVSSLMPREMEAWQRVVTVAQSVIGGSVSDPTRGANTFYATRLGTPAWTRRGTGRMVIGAHTYVRLPGR